MPSNREIELLHRLNKRKNKKISSAKRSDGYTYPSGNKRRDEIRYKDGIPYPNPERANSLVDIIPFTPHTLAIESVLSAAAEGGHPALALGAALVSPSASKRLLNRTYPKMVAKYGGPKDYKGAEKSFREGVEYTRKYYSNPKVQSRIPVQGSTAELDMELLNRRLTKAKREDIFQGFERHHNQATGWYGYSKPRYENNPFFGAFKEGTDKIYFNKDMVPSKLYNFLYPKRAKKISSRTASVGAHETDHFLRTDPNIDAWDRFRLRMTPEETRVIKKGLEKKEGIYHDLLNKKWRKIIPKNKREEIKNMKYLSEPWEIAARITEVNKAMGVNQPMRGFFTNEFVKRKLKNDSNFKSLRNTLGIDTITELLNAR